MKIYLDEKEIEVPLILVVPPVVKKNLLVTLHSLEKDERAKTIESEFAKIQDMGVSGNAKELQDSGGESAKVEVRVTSTYVNALNSYPDPQVELLNDLKYLECLQLILDTRQSDEVLQKAVKEKVSQESKFWMAQDAEGARTEVDSFCKKYKR